MQEQLSKSQLLEKIRARQAEFDNLNNPHRYSWWEGEPLWPNIAGNTYEHIDEHVDAIQQWLANNK